jgi:hypothetical protein
MKKPTPAILTLICATGLSCAQALADTVTFSIAPTPLAAVPGDVGDSFEVLLTNGGTGSISVAGFAFQVSVTDTDVTFTNANFSTTPNAYIFASDSFDQLDSFPLVANTLPGQVLDGDDLTNDGAGIQLNPGASLALGEVFFNVAANAVTGSFAVSFTGSNSNLLNDPSGNPMAVGALTGGTIDIAAATTVPEPSSLFLALGAMAALAAWTRRRRA